MGRIETKHANYINLAANTWTSLNNGNSSTFAVSPAGKMGRLYVSTTGGTIIALSLDAGATYHMVLPSNVVVDMGQIDPYSLHARCSAANNIITWWWVTD